MHLLPFIWVIPVNEPRDQTPAGPIVGLLQTAAPRRTFTLVWTSSSAAGIRSFRNLPHGELMGQDLTSSPDHHHSPAAPVYGMF